MPKTTSATKVKTADLEAQVTDLQAIRARLSVQREDLQTQIADAEANLGAALGDIELGERVPAKRIQDLKSGLVGLRERLAGTVAAAVEIDRRLAAAESELARAQRLRLLDLFHGDVARAGKVVAVLIDLERQAASARGELDEVLSKLLDHARSLGGDRSLEVPDFAAALWNATTTISGSASSTRGAIALASTDARDWQVSILRALRPILTAPAAVAGDPGASA